MRLHDTLTLGAFMAIGLEHTIQRSSEKVLEHWGNGHYELVHATMQYAPYCGALLDAGFAHMQYSPGVAAYEVAEEFGGWYGAEVQEADQGSEPPAEACRAKLRVLVTAFFNPINAASLSKVLQAVAVPDYTE